tara:strand:+ start:215 stop:643 length:429 start_codon:yes stop_codon:yes gene_type:complete
MQNKQREKKLTSLADDLLKRVEQADHLKELAKRNPVEASRVSVIVNAFMDTENVSASDLDKKIKIYDKIRVLVDVIDRNMTRVKKSGTSNFDWSEYSRDSGVAFNIKAKMSATGIYNHKQDYTTLNELYKKHLNIQKLLDNI